MPILPNTKDESLNKFLSAQNSENTALVNKFNSVSGHKHTGTAGDAPKIDSANATYASAVSGFTPTTVAAALDALAGARIIEFGSNSNGSYAKWENGLQICWVVGMYTTSLPFTFPAAFISVPAISYTHQPYTAQGDTGVYPHYETLSVTTNGTQMNLAHNTGTGGGYVNYLAIGRWK